MSNLIDKSALVAEIEKRKHRNLLINEGAFEEDIDILSFINTLEVKEVDLDKYINKYFKRWYVDLTDQGNILHSPDGQAGLMSVKKVAKHFFELGLKVKQNINIDVTNIDKVIEENGVDPNSKEAKIFKESYYMALEKLKAQKG